MGLLTRVVESRSSHPSNPIEWFINLFGGDKTATGKRVNAHTAYNYVAWYACVNKISKTIASLPLKVYESDGRGKTVRTDHPVYRVLHDRPNPYLTHYHFEQAQVAHVLNEGNAYALIDRVDGQVSALWPVAPNKMRNEWIKQEDGSYKLFYFVTIADGTERVLHPDEVLHRRGLASDGINGMSPVELFRETIAVGLSLEEYGARFFSNGAAPLGTLTSDNRVSDPARERMKKDWAATYGGLENSNKVALLEEGTKFQPMGVNPETAQMLESKRFGVIEIARINDIPLHKVQEMSAATFGNIEHQGIEYKVDTITPHLVNFEMQYNTELFLPSEQGRIFTKYVADGMLRGDTAARSAFYMNGKQWGYLSTNDIRELEDMNPVDGGDDYYIPLNMIPMTKPLAPAPVPAARSCDCGKEHRQIEAGEVTADELRTREIRSRFLKNRAKIKKQYQPMIEDITSRIVKREKADIMRKAEKVLKSRSVDDLLSWLDTFYAGLPDYIQKQAHPTYQSFIGAINESASTQVGIDAATASQIETWAKQYTEGFANRYAGNNLGTLRATLIEAQNNDADPLEALTSQFTDFEENQPARTFTWESTFISSAIAGATWELAGFSEEVWVADGGACPICEELDGVTASITESFVSAGSFDYGDGQTTEVHRDILHPPLHEWPGQCACDVAPA